MKAYTTAKFAYSRNKWKNSFAKVKNKNCQGTTITTRITFVCVSVQWVKCSKVGIMKGTLWRGSAKALWGSSWQYCLIY